MKNLKQVLALGMAFSLSLSTMASAAFTDQNDIKATEAVDMLSALGVVQGYEDGSFKPEGTVTRGEAAKMIFTIRNGGNSNADSFKSVASSFTDIKGHWAEGYIKYCQSMGIIAGKSATSFDPNGTVTGVELAKMMLVTLGYDAQTAGLVGSTWSQKTLSLAGENGLLDDVNTDLASGCPRQYAAQIMYNAILAPTVVLRENVYSNKNLMGQDNDTVGKKYMGLIETVVTLNGDSKSVDAISKGETQVYVAKDDIGTEISKGDTTKTITYTVDKIESKIGENFKLLWKDTNNNKDLDKNDKVYGMYSSNTTTVLNITANDVEKEDDDTIKLDGTKYDLAKNDKDTISVKINVNGEDAKDNATNVDGIITAVKDTNGSLKNGNKVRVVLDDNNKVSAVYIIKSDLYKVTSVSGDKISIAGIGTIDKTKNDNVVYDGIAKDDVVAVTKLYDSNVDDATFVVEKAETVSGKLTGYSSTKNVVVDGTTYKIYNETDMKTGLTDDSIKTMDNDKIDETVTLYLVNGYVRAAKTSAEEAGKYAVVSEADGKLGSTFDPAKAELILADGTKKTVTLHKDSAIYSGVKGEGTTQVANDGSASSAIKTELVAGNIVKYVEMSNGEFKVTEVGTNKAATVIDDEVKIYDKDTKSVNIDPKTTNNPSGTNKMMVTSGDCVLFYNNDKNGTELKATTIRSLNDIKIEDKEYSYVTKDGKVVAVYVDYKGRPSGVSASTMYGIVTSDGQTTNNSAGDSSTMFTVATNDNQETKIYVSGTTSQINGQKIAKGALVSFDKTSDDIYDYSNITVYEGTKDNVAEGKAVAVTDYNEADKTITYATAFDLDGSNNYVVPEGAKETKAVDSDVKIAYVNADDDTAGSANYGVNEYDVTKGYANALLVFDGDSEDNKVVAIIVNTDPDVDVMGGKNVAVDVSTTLNNPSVADVNKAFETAKNVIVNNLTIGGNTALEVPSNCELNVTGTLTVSAMTDFNKVTGTLKAAKIDATSIAAGVNSENLDKLLGYSLDVSVEKVTDATTINKAGAVVTIGSAEDTLTVTDAESVTVNGTVGGNVTLNGGTTTITGAINGTVTLTGTANATIDSATSTITDGAKTTLKMNGAWVSANGTTINGNVTLVAKQTGSELEKIVPASGANLTLNVDSDNSATNSDVGADLKFWATAGKSGENGTSAVTSGVVKAGTYKHGTAYYQTSDAGDTSASDVWVVAK